jgi:hypothetical protein
MKTTKTLFGSITTSIVLASALFSGCGRANTSDSSAPQNNTTPTVHATPAEVQSSSGQSVAVVEPRQEVDSSPNQQASEGLTTNQLAAIRAIGQFSTFGDSLLHFGLAYSTNDVMKSLLGVGTLNFLQIGAESDLRIIDYSKTTNSPLPAAYILFGNDSINVTEQILTNDIESGLEFSSRESADAIAADDALRLHVYGRGPLDFTNCLAVGLALFTTSMPFAENQGLGGESPEAYFALIEPGSALQKALMVAPYFTNFFTVAASHEEESIKPFLGTWKLDTSVNGDVTEIDIADDHTFKCVSSDSSTNGTYWVDYFDTITFSKGGKAWSSGKILPANGLAEGGCLNLSAEPRTDDTPYGNYDAPRGPYKKVQ